MSQGEQADPPTVVQANGPTRGRALAWLAVIVLAGAAIRFWGIDDLPLWFDEAASYDFANRSWSDIWNNRAEFNPPLYYSLQKAWLVFGDSEAALRSLSAVIGVATIGLVYGLGSTLGGRRVGLVAAALLATSPIHVQYSQEARTYALLIAAATLALWCLALVLDIGVGAHEGQPLFQRRKRLPWAGYFLSLVVALYAHNTAALIPVITGAAFLCWWWVRARWRVRPLLEWAAVHVLVILAWSWWLPTVLTQGSSLDKWHNTAVTPYKAVAELSTVYGQEFAPLRPAAELLFLVLAAWGAWRWRRRPLTLAFVLVVVAGLPLLTAAIGVSRMIYMARSLLWPIGMLMVLIAVGTLGWRNRRVAIAAVTVALLVQAAGLARYHTGFTKLEPWDALAQRLGESARPGDVVLAFPSYAEIALRYYRRLEARGEPRLIGASTVPGREDLFEAKATGRPLNEEIGDAARVWLVLRGGDRIAQPLLSYLDPAFEERSRERWDKLSLTLLERPPPGISPAPAGDP